MAGRFVGLDGLRGVAAISVVLYYLQITRSSEAAAWFPSSYLAVDLFFMLSGFVVAHAYEDRLIEGLTVRRFFEIRVLRLYPLYALGCSIALAIVVLPAAVEHELWRAKSVVVAAPAAAFMVPMITDQPSRWFMLNPPAWSLFYELSLNLLYAALLLKLGSVRLAVICFLTLTGIAYILITRSVINGPDAPPLCGALRAIFGLGTGVLGFRAWRSRTWPALQVPPFLAYSLFISITLIPDRGAATVLLTLPTLLFLIPAIIAVSLSWNGTHRKAKIAAALGELSYPIYVLHWPIISGVRVFAPQRAAPVLVDSVACLLTLIVSWAALYLYDRPVRSAVSRWLKLKRSAAPAVAAF